MLHLAGAPSPAGLQEPPRSLRVAREMAVKRRVPLGIPFLGGFLMASLWVPLCMYSFLVVLSAFGFLLTSPKKFNRCDKCTDGCQNQRKATMKHERATSNAWLPGLRGRLEKMETSSRLQTLLFGYYTKAVNLKPASGAPGAWVQLARSSGIPLAQASTGASRAGTQAP